MTVPATTPVERLVTFEKRTVDAATTVERGDALADYSAQMFETLDGVIVHDKKVISADRCQEIDIVLWNEQAAGPKGLSFLPHVVLVESKNWDAPVGAAEVAWFKEKVRLSGDYSSGGATGILVATNGVSGETHDRDFAVSIVLNARAERIRILVIRAPELAVKPEELRTLLRQRIANLAGGRVATFD